MKKRLDTLDRILLSGAALCFFVIFAVSMVEIILRSVFGKSLLWTNDLCVLLSSWTMLLGGAVVVHRGDHLIVDFLVNMMPKRIQLVVNLVTRILFFVVAAVLAYNGVIVAQLRMGLYYTTLRWPTGLAYLALPVFGVCSCLFLLDKIVDLIRQMRHREIVPETKE